MKNNKEKSDLNKDNVKMRTVSKIVKSSFKIEKNEKKPVNVSLRKTNIESIKKMDPDAKFPSDENYYSKS